VIWQSIYRFRGAQPEVFKAYEVGPEAGSLSTLSLDFTKFSEQALSL
jgi:ATP-dependent exoDNAse (exonuclease V) beta subunit